MDSWGYSVTSLDALLLTLFEKYAQLLKKRFSDDFQEIVSTDDYMPMPINNLDEYDKVVNVSWYTPDKDRESLTFPCVLPFSQMYPLCCIDIRNFLNQIYLFSDDHFQNSSVIDETLKNVGTSRPCADANWLFLSDNGIVVEAHLPIEYKR
ncbi:Rab GTPase-binding exocyst subunit S15 [Cryomyces antarcticus]|nr:Rab GTPase-binding exocyst subunit S15 [Cryomyces antarcticus]